MAEIIRGLKAYPKGIPQFEQAWVAWVQSKLERQLTEHVSQSMTIPIIQARSRCGLKNWDRRRKSNNSAQRPKKRRSPLLGHRLV